MIASGAREFYLPRPGSFRGEKALQMADLRWSKWACRRLHYLSGSTNSIITSAAVMLAVSGPVSVRSSRKFCSAPSTVACRAEATRAPGAVQGGVPGGGEIFGKCLTETARPDCR